MLTDTLSRKNLYANRSNEALESARQTLESARAQRAAKPATKTPVANDLELAKAKLEFTKLSGGQNK